MQTSTGPGYLLLLALDALSPLILKAAGFGILVAMASFIPRLGNIMSRLHEGGAVRLLAMLTAAFAGIYMFVPHWLNLRFISAIYAPICLFAGLALRQWLLVARNRLRPLVFRGVVGFAAIVVAIQLTLDVRRVSREFIAGGSNDLSVGLVLRGTKK